MRVFGPRHVVHFCLLGRPRSDCHWAGFGDRCSIEPLLEGRYRFVVRCRRRTVIHRSRRTAPYGSTSCRRDSRTVPPVAFSASSGTPARAVAGVAPNRVGKPRTYAPIVRRRKDVADRFLSEAERLFIAEELDIGISIRAIAETIGRSASAVSREIRRNHDAVSRRHHPMAHTARRSYVGDVLASPSSPSRPNSATSCGRTSTSAQVAKADLSLPAALIPDDAEMRVSHETLYQALSLPSRGDLEPRPARVLRSGRSRRSLQRLDRRFTRFVEPMTMIVERSVEVAERLVADCLGSGPLMARKNRSATATLGERKSVFLELVHLLDGHNAEQMSTALIVAASDLPAHLRRSPT